jgi:hypothetical protein
MNVNEASYFLTSRAFCTFAVQDAPRLNQKIGCRGKCTAKAFRNLVIKVDQLAAANALKMQMIPALTANVLVRTMARFGIGYLSYGTLVHKLGNNAVYRAFAHTVRLTYVTDVSERIGAFAGRAHIIDYNFTFFTFIFHIRPLKMRIILKCLYRILHGKQFVKSKLRKALIFYIHCSLTKVARGSII